MTLASFTSNAGDAPGSRPRDDELDLHGLTHPGRARSENQDHFLLGTVHAEVLVHGTNLPGVAGLPLRGERLATIMLVADGVAGSADGTEASRLATEAVTRYVAFTLRCYHAAAGGSDDVFLDELRRAALEAHETVRAEGARRPDGKAMATTLSLGIVVWPWLYVVQVGDSRCYLYQERELRQLTRDQTLAQDLVDQGVLARDRAQASPLKHVLSSAIGSEQAAPEVTRVDVRRRGCVILVCTDGLTKHVADAEIAAALERMTSAEQVAGELLHLALERGGTDNITIVVGRVRPAA